MNRFRNSANTFVIFVLSAICIGARAQEAQSDEHAQHALHEGMHHAVPASTPHATPQSAASEAEAPSASGHIAPPPPKHPMPPMSADAMIDAMGMNDDATFAKLRVDRLERSFRGDAPTFSWDVDAWIGRDFDKLRIRSEGEHARGTTEDADVEALWSRAVAAYWDTEIGVRQDVGGRGDRTWLAFGIQGLAPYWFELGATAYVGDGGRTALRVEADYDLSLTQRLILQPRVEINAYGNAGDRQSDTGSQNAAVGLRLRYETRREIAPYVGFEQSWGASALPKEPNESARDTKWLLGIRMWF